MEHKQVIYVADDDEDILDIISTILLNLGFTVETTMTGEFRDPEKADLYLLDINLSGRNGGDICKKLKAHPKTSQIPIILISANEDIKTVCIECGADGYLRKPFEIKALEELVKNRLRIAS